MAKGKIKPAEQGGRRPPPPPEHRFKPGQSGNPKGRAPNAGATLREWINQLAAKDLTEQQLRRTARDPKAPWTKRAAAERVLRTLEHGDLADMQEFLDGEKNLVDLRNMGINTEVIKRSKARRRTCTDKAGNVEVTVERELELHDRAGGDFDRVSDRTDGRPTQHAIVDVNLPTAVSIITPLTHDDRPDPAHPHR